MSLVPQVVLTKWQLITCLRALVLRGWRGLGLLWSYSRSWQPWLFVFDVNWYHQDNRQPRVWWRIWLHWIWWVSWLTIQLIIRTTIVVTSPLSLSCGECDWVFDRITKWSSLGLSSNIILSRHDASTEAFWISVVEEYITLIVNYVWSPLWDSPSDWFTTAWQL